MASSFLQTTNPDHSKYDMAGEAVVQAPLRLLAAPGAALEPDAAKCAAALAALGMRPQPRALHALAASLQDHTVLPKVKWQDRVLWAWALAVWDSLTPGCLASVFRQSDIESSEEPGLSPAAFQSNASAELLALALASVGGICLTRQLEPDVQSEAAAVTVAVGSWPLEMVATPRSCSSPSRVGTRGGNREYLENLLPKWLLLQAENAWHQHTCALAELGPSQVLRDLIAWLKGHNRVAVVELQSPATIGFGAFALKVWLKPSHSTGIERSGMELNCTTPGTPTYDALLVVLEESEMFCSNAQGQALGAWHLLRRLAPQVGLAAALFIPEHDFTTMKHRPPGMDTTLARLQASIS